jgi:hypothetical protein
MARSQGRFIGRRTLRSFGCPPYFYRREGFRLPGKNPVIGYTEFCDKLLDLFAAFELAAIDHHDLPIALGGRFA